VEAAGSFARLAQLYMYPSRCSAFREL